jgi:prepilin-type N-terminal cleavage/methylation domain-containing protein
MRREDGFTLTELMATIAVVGILSTGAMVTLRRPEDPGHGAIRLTNAVRQCTRLAVSRGPVRADVATALGSTARARLVVRPESGSSAQVVAVELLEEAAEPSTDAEWSITSQFRFSGSIRVAGVRSSSELTAGLGPATLIDSSEVAMECTPDGAAQAITYYLDGDAGESERVRVVVMPLAGEPLTMDGW